MAKPPITNCHTHVFTGKHVPAYLGRGILPWPFYYLLPLHPVLRLMVWCMRLAERRHTVHWRNRLAAVRKVRAAIARNALLALLDRALHVWLTVIFLDLLLRTFGGPGWVWLEEVQRTLLDLGLLWPTMPQWLAVLLGLYLFCFVAPARQLILQVARLLWKFLDRLPTRQLKELWDRYKLIAIYTTYGARSTGARSGQHAVFTALENQYPQDSRFILLPMDMAYMGAGPLGKGGGFAQQMQELLAIAKSSGRAYPFIFIDPRRIADEGKAFLDWQMDEDGHVALKPCSVGSYLREGGAGFKIYPALGYHVFDEALLPLWLFAAQNGIPIMSHCIRGVIHYRGRKRKEWMTHPVFKRQARTFGPEGATPGDFVPLELTATKGADFQADFTHPLNYLCLLHEPLLRTVVARANVAVQQAFGYTNVDTPLMRDLTQLKLCFAHFGGEDEWARHLEDDRGDYAQQLNVHPGRGLDFGQANGQLPWNRYYRHWHEVDWYTIICSLMLQFPNVYADVSYILHQAAIRPLLLHTLQHGPNAATLSQRVLFGTDFYVVRNHRSDKELLTDLQAGLDTALFDRMARSNPEAYLHMERP